MLRFRIPTWKRGYYIYCIDDVWYNESGTKVLLEGWKTVLDQFEVDTESLLEENLKVDFGSCLHEYLFELNTESTREQLKQEIIKILQKYDIYDESYEVNVEVDNNVFNITISGDVLECSRNHTN